MVLICCCRKYSRCCWSMSSRARICMDSLISASCTSPIQYLQQTISTCTQCINTQQFNLLIFFSGRFVQIKSTKNIGFVIFLMANAESCGNISDDLIYLIVRSLQASTNAWNSLSFCQEYLPPMLLRALSNKELYLQFLPIPYV